MTAESKEIFRKNLHHLMIEQDRSQDDVAKHLGTSQSAVSHWLVGRNFPRGETIVKIADYFNVSPSTLTKRNAPLRECVNLYDEEKLLRDFRMLSPKGKEKALERMEELKQLYWYEKEEMLVNVL